MTNKWRKKAWAKKKIQHLQVMYWDKEFTKRQLEEMKESMRQAKTRIHDQVDAAGRKVCELKYDLYYSETGDKVKVTDVPIAPEEIMQLPDHKTKKSRFHKVTKAKYDKKIVENLERGLKKYVPELGQIDGQMKAIHNQIHGPLIDEQGNDISIVGVMDGYQEVIKLLKKYRRDI